MFAKFLRLGPDRLACSRHRLTTPSLSRLLPTPPWPFVSAICASPSVLPFDALSARFCALSAAQSLSLSSLRKRPAFPPESWQREACDHCDRAALAPLFSAILGRPFIRCPERPDHRFRHCQALRPRVPVLGASEHSKHRHQSLLNAAVSVAVFCHCSLFGVSCSILSCSRAD